MSEPIFPLDLISIFFINSTVVAIEGHIPSSTPVRTRKTPVNKLSIEKIETSDNEYAVTMSCSFNPEKDSSEPYFIEVTCMAIFKVVRENMPQEEIIKALTITGNSVTFGAIRENVLWNTSRSILGPFTLGLSVLKPTTEPQSHTKT